jgi:hypothetical protein
VRRWHNGFLAALEMTWMAHCSPCHAERTWGVRRSAARRRHNGFLAALEMTWMVLRARCHRAALHDTPLVAHSSVLASGSSTVNTLPWPSALSTLIVPPWSVTTSCTTNSPIPIPEIPAGSALAAR